MLCTCDNGCKFCRNSSTVSGPLKFKVGDKVRHKKNHTIRGEVASITYSDRSYLVVGDNGDNAWRFESTLELDDGLSTDYRALIQTELNEIEAQILKLKERVEFLTTAKNVLDELDKKA